MAYVKRFGLFAADVVLIIVNSDDSADAPTFEPLDDRRPRRKPLSAFLELVERWMRRSLRRRRNRKKKKQPVCAEATRACLDALRKLIEMGRAEGASVLLVQHLTQDELENGPEQGHREIARVAQEMNLVPLSLSPAFDESLRQGKNPYRDRYHPNEQGQRVIAEVLYEPILEALSARVT